MTDYALRKDVAMRLRLWFVVGLLILVGLVACSDESSSATAVAVQDPAGTPFDVMATTQALPTPIPPTATPIPPTPTPADPPVATVNDQPVTQSQLAQAVAQRNLGLQGAADPELSEAEIRAQMLDILIEQALIAQAAAANNILVTAEEVDAAYAELRQAAETAGGAGSFEVWLQENRWTEADLRAALAQQMLTERVIAFVTADVPATAPQAHARYLQVDDPVLAQSLADQLLAGADFATLAQANSLDRQTAQDGGDLGWFPAGTLLVPEVDAAAFSLQPGGVSPVIAVTNAETGATSYYLVQLIEIDPQRPLTADARAVLLQERFESWLAQLWANAEIVRYTDPGTQ